MRSRPREDGLPSVIAVNPAAQTVTVQLGAGEEPVVMQTAFDKLLALAEQLCQERCPIVFRPWPQRDFIELVELYRAPSTGWQDRERGDDELF